MASPLTLAVVTGLSIFISQHAMGNLGWDEAYGAPVFVGDKQYAESRVEEVRPSDFRPSVVIVTVRTAGSTRTVWRC